MTCPPFLLYSLRDDVTVDVDPALEVIVLSSRWGDTVLPRPAAVVLEAIRRMSLGPSALVNVLSTPADWLRLWGALAPVGHLVVWSLGSTPEQPSLSVVPLAPEARFGLPWPGSVADPAGPRDGPDAGPAPLVRLSRFARIATTGHLATVESPLSLFRVVVHEAGALARMSPLMSPVDPATLAAEDQVMTRYLLAAGIAVASAGDGPAAVRFAEDTDPALSGWTPVDLAFHTQSTLGRHDHDFGATFPLGERAAVEPVVAARAGGPVVPLPRPDWADVVRSPPFAAVLEAATPVRSFGEPSPSLTQLGSLLYLTARVRSLIGSPDPVAPEAGSDRPYPACTDAYELELYAAVRSGPGLGLGDGVYHYDPLRHQLVTVGAGAAGVGELHEMARVEAGLPAPPAVVLLVTARFRRLSWRYAGPPYALVLKDVGMLTQSLSLACTALGLASCPLRAVDLETSRRVLGTDWRSESAVGGLVVGHRPPAGPAPRPAYAVNDAPWAERARRLLRPGGGPPTCRISPDGV